MKTKTDMNPMYENCMEFLGDEHEKITLESFVEIQSKNDADLKIIWDEISDIVKDSDKKYKSLYIHFETKKDMEDFSKLINQKINKSSKELWYTKNKQENNSILEDFLEC